VVSRWLAVVIDHPRSSVVYNFSCLCLSDDKFQKPWCRKFVFAHVVYLHAVLVRFVYEGHWVKVTVRKCWCYPVTPMLQSEHVYNCLDSVRIPVHMLKKWSANETNTLTVIWPDTSLQTTSIKLQEVLTEGRYKPSVGLTICTDHKVYTVCGQFGPWSLRYRVTSVICLHANA